MLVCRPVSIHSNLVQAKLLLLVSSRRAIMRFLATIKKRAGTSLAALSSNFASIVIVLDLDAIGPYL